MQPPPHLAGLTGLRGLAALAVFGVHYNQVVRVDAQLGPFDLARLLANGEHGVSLFFTLSGLLLALPFWQALAAGSDRPRLGAYAAKRLARIVPAYYALLTLLIVASGLWRHPAAWPDIALHYGFLFNLTEFSIFSLNPPFWTLAVEMQFYALLPALFVGLARVRPQRRLALLASLAVLAYALHYGLVSSVTRVVDWPLDPRFAWVRPYGAVVTHSLLAHLPHFLLGVIAGALMLRARAAGRAGPARRAGVNEALFWGALALTAVLLGTALNDAVQVPYGRYTLPLVPLLLTVVLVTAPAAPVARRCLETPPVRALGTLSYGVYLYHVPCLGLVDRALAARGVDAADHPLAFGAAGLTLTVLAAALSWVVVERPVQRLARRVA